MRIWENVKILPERGSLVALDARFASLLPYLLYILMIDLAVEHGFVAQ